MSQETVTTKQKDEAGTDWTRQIYNIIKQETKILKQNSDALQNIILKTKYYKI